MVKANKIINGFFIVSAILMLVFSLLIANTIKVPFMDKIMFLYSIFTFVSSFLNILLELIIKLFKRNVNEYVLIYLPFIIGIGIDAIILYLSLYSSDNGFYKEILAFQKNGGFVSVSIMLLLLTTAKSDISNRIKDEDLRHEDRMKMLNKLNSYKERFDNEDKEKIDDIKNIKKRNDKLKKYIRENKNKNEK